MVLGHFVCEGPFPLSVSSYPLKYNGVSGACVPLQRSPPLPPSNTRQISIFFPSLSFSRLFFLFLVDVASLKSPQLGDSSAEANGMCFSFRAPGNTTAGFSRLFPFFSPTLFYIFSAGMPFLSIFQLFLLFKLLIFFFLFSSLHLVHPFFLFLTSSYLLVT